MSRPSVMRAKDGRMLCTSHRTTGAPLHHYPGCQMCEEARAKGIIRPDAASVPLKRRGRGKHREKNYDWNKIPKERRGDLAFAIQAGKYGA